MPDDRDRLASAVVTLGIERVDVINRRRVIGAHEVFAVAVSESGASLQTRMAREKIVKSAVDKFGRLDILINNCGKMRFARNCKPMDLHAECALRNLRGSAETDPVSAGGNAVNGKSLLFEPRGNLRDIARARPETLGELFRRQPVVKFGRCRVLLGGEQRVEIGLLRWGWLEREGQVMEKERPFHLTAIYPGLRAGVDMAGNNDGPVAFDPVRVPVGLGGQRYRGDRCHHN